MSCKHEYVKPFSINDVRIEFRCKKCQEPFSRLLTKSEIKTVKGDLFKQFNDPDYNLHGVWHEFIKRFYKAADKHCLGEWKYVGYDLMEKAEEFAKEFPDRVFITSVDDDHFTSSYLVMFSSENKFKFMGISCLFIPQLGGEPTEFFMYPGHIYSLKQNLTEIQKRIDIERSESP